jgi:hypothetical protein
MSLMKVSIFDSWYPTQPMVNSHHGQVPPSDTLLWPVPVAARFKGVGPRPLAYCDRGLYSHRGHGCLSVVCVVFCLVEVSATS